MEEIVPWIRIPGRNHKIMPREITKRMPKGISREIFQRIPDGFSKGIPWGGTAWNPGRMPGEMKTSWINSISLEIPEVLPTGIDVGISKIVLGENLEGTFKEISKRFFSEDILGSTFEKILKNPKINSWKTLPGTVSGGGK